MRDRIVRYALPLFGSQLVQFAGSAAALLAVGHFGVSALGGIAAPLALLSLCCAIFFGFTTGTTILVSRARTAGDDESAARVAGQGLGIALLLGAAFALCGLLFAPSALATANVRAELLPIAVPYTRALALFIPVLFLFMMYAAIFDGLGELGTASGMWGVSTLLYLGLLVPATAALSFVGVPFSAIVATFAVSIFAAVGLHKRYPQVRVRPLLPTWRMLHDMLVLDLAVSAQYVGVALADLALVGVVNDYGAGAAAAYVVVYQIAALAMVPGVAFATAASAFASESAMRMAQLLGIAVTAAVILALYALAGPLISAFVHDPQTAQIAKSGLFAMLWSVLALNGGGVVSGFVDACGQSLWPMMASLAGVWLLLVPLAHLFSRHSGVIGVWEAYPYAYVSICMMQLAYYAFARKRGYLNETAPV